MCFLQLQILTDWQDKKGDKRFLKVKDADLVTSRHSKPKKQKLDGKGSHAPGPGPGRPKTKNLQPKVQEFDFSEDPQEIPRNPKNDAPNRYNSACTEDAVIFKRALLLPVFTWCVGCVLQILGFSGAILC